MIVVWQIKIKRINLVRILYSTAQHSTVYTG